MMLCADTARPPGQAMYHTALAFTTMHPEKHFRVPDYLPAPFGTKSASNVHVTKSQKLLRTIQYYFYEKKASQDMPNPFHHIIHFMGSPAALISESPLNASLHDISELPLLGTSSSFKIDTPTVTVKLLPLPLLPGLNYSKSPTLIIQHFIAIVQSQVTLPSFPFMCSHIAYTADSPFHASLHDISELPLSGLFHSIPHDTPVIYLMLTNIQPSRNPAGAFHPSSTKLSTPSLFQVHPKLVPLQQCNCFIWCLLFCNECVSPWYGVRYNPGEKIQQQLTLDLCIWNLCYSFTATFGKSHSFLSKSPIHCWKRAAGRTLLRSPFRDTLRTMFSWPYHHGTLALHPMFPTLSLV
jgi:hypothetical protein